MEFKYKEFDKFKLTKSYVFKKYQILLVQIYQIPYI